MGKYGRLAVITALTPKDWTAHVVNPRTSDVLYKSNCLVQRAAEKNNDMAEINMALRTLHEHTATLLWQLYFGNRMRRGTRRRGVW